jgi:ACDE family multidrug resistance protein
VIYAITVTGILSNTIVGPAIPDLLRDLHQPDSRAGLFVAAASVPGIVVAPVIGILADRFGRRNVVVPCLVVFGIFGGVSALAPTFELLLLCRLMQGIGSAGLINLAVVLLGDHWTGAERARLIGRNAAVLTVCLAILPPVGGGLAEVGGWRLTFAPYPLALVIAVICWRQLPPTVKPEAITLSDQLRAARTQVRKPLVLCCTVAGFVVFLLIFGLFLTTLPVHLADRFHLGPGLRGLVLGSPAFTSTATALSLGRLRARYGARRLLLTAACLYAVSFIAMGLAGSLAVLLPAALVYGLGEGIFIPTLQDVVAGAATPATRGATLAAFIGSARAGQTAGPLVASGVSGVASAEATFIAGGILSLALVAFETKIPFDDEPGQIGEVS